MAEEKPIQVQQGTSPAGAERTRMRRLFSPDVDIYEKADAYILLADMPGADEKSININLENNLLTIMGSMDVKRPEGYELSYAEFGIGDYERSFTITEAIDRNKIDAAVKDGVLRLTLPKGEAAKPKKIKVKPM
jgi:HSP20 family protein